MDRNISYLAPLEMKINQAFFRTIWPVVEGGAVEIIDQTQLPHRLHIVRIATLDAMVHAIRPVSYTHLTLPTKA